MGYTHYINGSTKCTKQAWASAIDDIQRVVAMAGIPLANGQGEPGTLPIFNEEEVYFNGVGPASHETFVVRYGGATVSDFCKTAQKPYDLMVCACLIILKRWIPTLKVSSDGGEEELGWGNAISLCQQVLGYGNFPCGDGAIVSGPIPATPKVIVTPPTDDELNGHITVNRAFPMED